MPAKKIDSAEHIRQEKRKTVKKKLIFATSFAVLVVATNLLMRQSPHEKDVQQAKQDVHEVLGEATEDERARLERVQRQAESIQEEVVDQSTIYLEEGKQQVEKKVSEIVYATTIQPLLDQIDKLSDDQQDYVREALCR